jgi:nucleoside phosphorylase
VEYCAARKHLYDLCEIQNPKTGSQYEIGFFTSNDYTWEILIAEIGKYDTTAAVETEEIISSIPEFSPDIVIFVGIAGGIKDLNLGDIVAVDRAFAYERGKQEKEFLSRPDSFNSNRRLIEIAKKIKKRKQWVDKPKLKIGSVASGEKVIVNIENDLFDFIHKTYNNAIAIDQESFGFLQTLHRYPSIYSIVIRGISDSLINKGESDKAGWQQIAATNASAVAFEILSEITPLDIHQNHGSDKSFSKIRHNLPIKPVNVVGRETDINLILKSLEINERAIILASGFGGVGKSTVARMVAWHCVENQGPFDFIAWVDSRQYSSGNLTENVTYQFVLDSIARAANPASEIIAIGDPEIKAARVRELLSNARSLLIIDNYEALLAKPDEEEKVSRFIESLPINPLDTKDAPFIRVLITTRVVSPNLSRMPIFNKRLESLSLENSLKMISSSPGAPHLTQKQWRRVWEILHGLPKYIQVAIEQLKVMPFAGWEAKFTQIQWRPNKPDDFFCDLFDFSWRNPIIISDDLKKLLISMTYFVRHTRSDALRQTSGLSENSFLDALPARYFTPYFELVREQSGQEFYSLHPLMFTYCQAAATSEEFQEFRTQASLRFIDYFLNFAKEAEKANSLNLLDDEIQNILAATKIAKKENQWECLIDFRKSIAGFLRRRGSWEDYCEVIEYAVEASRFLGQEELLAECLIFDLAWYYLRLEDIPNAQKLISEGLDLFNKQGNLSGIAQAKRHQGKAALLEGLDEKYLPNLIAETCFVRAEGYYKESLNIREQLQNQGNEQSLAIADMKLDLGRLYWLQGLKLEQDARSDQAGPSLKNAFNKYELAEEISVEALSEFEKMPPSDTTKGRISKAWGNRGNALKAIAACMAENEALNSARKFADSARECYEKNLSLGEDLSKKDEIAHALAGLAEVDIIAISWAEQAITRRTILDEARIYAQKAQRLYEELAGPRSRSAISGGSPMKTRDEIRMARLMETIEQLVAR